MKAVFMVAGAFALSGCLAAGPLGEQMARDTAKVVVNDVVSTRYPGVPTALVTDCIIDNASIAEIGQIAQAAALGSNAAATDLILDIAARPATVNCISEKALTSLVLGL